MNRTLKALVLVLIVGVLASGMGCKLLHDKVVDIVLQHKACMLFQEREDSANYATPETVDVAPEIDDALAEAEINKDKITEAKLLGGSYEIKWLEDPGYDWVISGEIFVDYYWRIPGVPVYYDHIAGPATIVEYDSQSLYAGLGAGPIFPDLHPDGVAIFNQALEDYLDPDMVYDPVLVFTTDGTVTPNPADTGDSLKFDWEGCMHIYVVSPYSVEAPDLFQ